MNEENNLSECAECKKTFSFNRLTSAEDGRLLCVDCYNKEYPSEQ